MTSPQQFSLFDELTGPKSTTHHAATGLILNLLQAVGHEACQTKHNTHYLYSVISEIRDAYDAVNFWIDQVDYDSGNVDQAWQVFTKYTGAIDPLEEYVRLARLFQLLLEDYNREQTYATNNDIENCFGLVESFETIRLELRITVDKLTQHFEEVCVIVS
ncbi:hypothetical protein L218DRAFT_857688 [Marasmius fiardii PR-910]|nr:hypothetical protein L218DRAFT_857688 [Marasmius fiardii PR-910]